MNQKEITVMYDAVQLAERREQRRYEIARECMGRLVVEYESREAAQEALEYADALLAAMDLQNRPAFGPPFPSDRVELNPLAHEQSK